MKRLIFILVLLLCCSAIQVQARGIMTMCGAGAAGGMAEVVSTTTLDGSGSITGSRLYCFGPLATAGTGTATVTKLSLYMTNSSAGLDIKLGLYTDASSAPDALVSYTTFADIGEKAEGYHDFAVNYTITRGNSYHVCLNASASSVMTLWYETLTEGGYTEYVALTYANAWPDTISGTTVAHSKRAVKFTYRWD